MSLTVTATTTVTGAETHAEILAKNSTEEAQDDHNKSVADAVSNPEVRTRAYEDVKALAQTVRDIRDLFQGINLTLLHFDKEKFKDVEGNDIQLQAQWSPKIERFEVDLQTSYEVAKEASAFIATVLTVITYNPATEYNFSDLKDEIDNFCIELGNKQQQALDMKNRFRTLSDDIVIFAEVLSQKLVDADAGMKKEIQDARNKVQALIDQLQELDKQMEDAQKAMIASFAIGLLACVAAVFTLTPAAIGVATASIMSGVAAKAKLEDIKTKKEGLQGEKDLADQAVLDLLAKQERLKKYTEAFEKPGGTKDLMRKAAGKIDIIANIWQTINLDMVSLKSSLSGVVAKDAKITKFFWGKLQPSVETYKLLKVCLDTYVEECQKVYGK